MNVCTTIRLSESSFFLRLFIVGQTVLSSLRLSIALSSMAMDRLRWFRTMHDAGSMTLELLI